MRKLKNTLEFTGILKSTLEYSRIHGSTIEYSRIHEITLEYSRMLMHEYTRIHESGGQFIVNCAKTKYSISNQSRKRVLKSKVVMNLVILDLL